MSDEIKEPTLKLCWNELAVRRAAEVLRAAGLQLMAEDVEAQFPKPAIKEPEAFGSVVRAGIDGLSDRVLWLRSASHYWFSETSRRADFSDLHHPEVLRIGVGDQKAEPLAEWESDLLNQQYRREVAVSVLEAIDVDQYLIDAVRNAAPPDGFCVCPPDGRAKDCGIRRHRVEALT